MRKVTIDGEWTRHNTTLADYLVYRVTAAIAAEDMGWTLTSKRKAKPNDKGEMWGTFTFTCVVPGYSNPARAARKLLEGVLLSRTCRPPKLKNVTFG